MSNMTNIIESYATVAAGSEDGYTDPAIYTTTNQVSPLQRKAVSVVSPEFAAAYSEALREFEGKENSVLIDTRNKEMKIIVTSLNDGIARLGMNSAGYQHFTAGSNLDESELTKLTAYLLAALSRIKGTI